MIDTGSFETIGFERRDDHVAVITLNRPERLNAINRKMIAEVGKALDVVEADANLRVVVVHGAGRAFCSGFDLKDDAAAQPSGVATWRRLLQQDFDFLIRFWDLSKPTIAAVHGYCLAGGCELAMACDITIAAENAIFGEPELRFGSVITALMMPWLVGPKRTKELLLTGQDRIPAAWAETIGLINRTVPDAKYLDEALAVAGQIARVDPDAVAMTKQSINRTFETMGMREALRANLDIAVQIENLETPERKKFQEITRREGLKAAIAWRDARFARRPKAPPTE
ncbi:MAG: enoyl-CoA hydratase/isomerase family protein [Betaproteobacteria bacterium]